MALREMWLSHRDDGVEVLASAARTGTGNSGDLNVSDVFGGDADVVPLTFGVLLDITVQGGTQASVDFDLEGKIAGKYVRLARYNSVPGDGVVAQLLVPVTGAKPLAIGDGRFLPVPAVYRLVWTFNTPGATPTITFSAHALGYAMKNSRRGWPGMR